MQNTSATTMPVAAIQRLDVDSVRKCLESPAKAGVCGYMMLQIKGYLAEFRAEATGTQHRSALEKVIRFFPQKTDGRQGKQAHHWQKVNVIESAVPMGFLSSMATLHGALTRDDVNALYANIQGVVVHKRQFCRLRRIVICSQELDKMFSVSIYNSNFTHTALSFGTMRHCKPPLKLLLCSAFPKWTANLS